MRRMIIIGCLSALSLATPAAADDAAQADQLFTDAKTAMAAGHIAEACDKFAASQKLEASPSTLMNLGDCREKNHQYASAWAAFVSAERRSRGDGRYGPMAQIAAGRAAQLEPRLSLLTINVADDVRVDGLVVTRDGIEIDAGAWNVALPIDGGTHTISGRAPGHEAWSTTVTVEPEGDRAAVEVPRFKALRDPSGKTVIIDRRTQAPSPWTARRKVGVGLGGGGVAALIAGAVLGLRARSLDDQAATTCPPAPEPCTTAQAERANDLAHQARTRAIAANVGFGVGIAAIAAGAVLWLTGAPRERARAVAIVPHLDGRTAGVSAAWSF